MMPILDYLDGILYLSHPRCGINGGRAVFYMQDGFGAVPYVLGKYPPCNGKAAE